MATGEELRAALDAALARESVKLGETIRWDEREQQHIDAACRAADAVELLSQRIAAAEQLPGDGAGTVIVKYLAERRLQDDKVSEHLKWLQLEEFAPLKSPQHVAAGQKRWEGVQRGRKGTA